MINPEIKPTIIRDGVELYQVKYAVQYVGMSNNALSQRVKKYNEAHPSDPILRKNYGGKENYYRKEDLDKLFEERTVE